MAVKGTVRSSPSESLIGQQQAPAWEGPWEVTADRAAGRQQLAPGWELTLRSLLSQQPLGLQHGLDIDGEISDF